MTSKYPPQEFPDICFRTIPIRGYEFVISNGGAALTGKGWTFEIKIDLPTKEQLAVMSDENLEALAEQAVQQYKSFAENAPLVKAFDENLKDK